MKYPHGPINWLLATLMWVNFFRYSKTVWFLKKEGETSETSHSDILTYQVWPFAMISWDGCNGWRAPSSSRPCIGPWVAAEGRWLYLAKIGSEIVVKIRNCWILLSPTFGQTQTVKSWKLSSCHRRIRSSWWKRAPALCSRHFSGVARNTLQLSKLNTTLPGQWLEFVVQVQDYAK